MTNKRFQEFLQKWFNEKISLNTKKSNDYAGEDETLKNFKQMSAILNDYEVRPPWTPAKMALVMCLMKIQRLLNIIQDCKVPKNEALDDTLQDQSLYTDLARACLIDEEAL